MSHPATQEIRNPFGVQDVPAPNDGAVAAFAEQAELDGSADDDNAAAWAPAAAGPAPEALDGAWTNRWNGGADPTIAGDTAAAWKAGGAVLRLSDDW